LSDLTEKTITNKCKEIIDNELFPIQRTKLIEIKSLENLVVIQNNKVANDKLIFDVQKEVNILSRHVDQYQKRTEKLNIINED